MEYPGNAIEPKNIKIFGIFREPKDTTIGTY